MKYPLLVVSALFVIGSVSAAGQAVMTKEQIEQAIAKTREEVSEQYKKISPNYDQQVAKIQNQQNKELESIQKTSATQIDNLIAKEKNRAAAFAKKVNDKYEPQIQKIYQQRDADLKEMLGQTNSKKYVIKQELAQYVDIPFAVPIIKEMAIAADMHDKDKLRTLLSSYFVTMVGKDWRQFMRRVKKEVGAGEIETIEIIDKASLNRTITSLAMLYFKVARPTTLDDMASLENRFLEKIFEVEK